VSRSGVSLSLARRNPSDTTLPGPPSIRRAFLSAWPTRYVPIWSGLAAILFLSIWASPKANQGTTPIARIALGSNADRVGPLPSKLLAFLAAHLCMLILMGGLVAHYQADPNGFRLNHLDVLAWFAVFTVPPLVVGTMARSRSAIGVIAAAHALSPLALINAMRTEDLNFALIIWWIPLPFFVGVVVITDWLIRSRRSA